VKGIAKLRALIPVAIRHDVRAFKASTRAFSVAIRRDITNLARYGRYAPKAYQRLVIPTEEITTVLSPKRFSENDSARVMAGSWDKDTKPLSDTKKYQTISKALRQDLDWMESGMLELYSGSKKYSKRQLQIRYDNLANIVNEIRADGRIKTRKELSSFNFREYGGVSVHIGSEGRAIFAGDGYHRLALAHLINVRTIPVCICVVHEDAVKSGVFRRLALSHSNTE
jgi:hypothetical protein